MNVISLFDGMSCTRMALEKLGVPVDNYFASEVDKYAIQAAISCFPDTKQLGSVEFVTKAQFHNHGIDLMVAGSPCQGFSNAGAGLNFSDPRSALFFEFLRLKKELKPKYWLLENVKMKKEWRDIITEYLGVEPTMINSSLLSAQNRTRYYWTNIPRIEQPEDLGLVLRDVIDYSENAELVDKLAGIENHGNIHSSGKGMNGWISGINGKARTLNTNKGEGPKIGWLERVGDKLRAPEATKKGYAEAGVDEGLDLSVPNSKTRRGRAMPSKSNCVTTSHNMGIILKAEKQLVWRRLVPKECARLQTVPAHHIENLLNSGVSNSQLYKMLGNGFTIDVVAYILSHIPNINNQ